MSGFTIYCRHCSSSALDVDNMEIEYPVEYDNGLSITQYSIECLECKDLNIIWSIENNNSLGLPKEISIWPFLNERKPCPSEVPCFIAEDYLEACLILPLSPKASAALSRRCLQNLLRDAAKVEPSDLYLEIQKVIESNQLPSYIEDNLHALRKIGNFAAHPSKSKTTGEIIPVEPGEAIWNLNTLVDLFDFYYVKPKRNAEKIKTLDIKSQDEDKESRKRKKN